MSTEKISLKLSRKQLEILDNALILRRISLKEYLEDIPDNAEAKKNLRDIEAIEKILERSMFSWIKL